MNSKKKNKFTYSKFFITMKIYKSKKNIFVNNCKTKRKCRKNKISKGGKYSNPKKSLSKNNNSEYEKQNGIIQKSIKNSINQISFKNNISNNFKYSNIQLFINRFQKYYPSQWIENKYEKEPGMIGFNQYCQELMKEYLVDSNFYSSCEDDTIKLNPNHLPREKGSDSRFPHQKVFQWLVHPFSPIKRLLAIHMTGAGKTRMIIDALSNYMFDPRAKIVVFPYPSQRDNFYQELIKYDSLIKEYLKTILEPSVFEELGKSTKNIQLVIDALAFKKKLFKLPYTGKILSKISNSYDFEKNNNYKEDSTITFASPIRAYSLREFINKVFRNDDILLKWGQTSDTNNPLDNHILMFDEVHNLVSPSEAWKKKYYIANRRLTYIGKLVHEAKKAVVVGFTATPFVKYQKTPFEIPSTIYTQKKR